MSDRCALNAREPAELPEGDAPEWLLLVPEGEAVIGADGRMFRSPGSPALLAEHQRRGLKLPVDENHATQLSPGRPARACGWITEFRLQDGALMGRVEWTARGAAAIQARDYRYYSPAYGLEWGDGPAPTIKGVDSVALVNVPNLGSAFALNNKESSMKDIAKKLGLPETATEQECLAAIERIAAPAAADGAQAVPRADYELMSKRASDAEQGLAQRERDDLRAAAEAAVDRAIGEGKFAPSSRDYYLGNCSTPEGLNSFKALASGAPALFKEAPGAAGQPPAADQSSLPLASDADAQHVYRQFGIKE